MNRLLTNLTVSWIGNTFPHGRGGTPSQKWVPQSIEDICVTPDGTVFTNVFWEEGGANHTEMKDGDVINQAHGSHGWGHQGGNCVAANLKYMYAGERFDNEGGGLCGRRESATNWPPKGFTWFGVTRRNRSNIRKGDPFEGGKGGKESPRGSFLVVHEVPTKEKATIEGLYATETQLFVSCPYDDTIKVYDANTMKPLGSWPVPDPFDLGMDRQGKLWVLLGPEGTRIARFDASGRRLPQEVRLPAGARATDLCVDSRNRLLVADASGRNQILIVEGLDGRPRLAGTFGEKGGVFGGPARMRGVVGERRFNHVMGVGGDEAGNVYVASTQRPACGGGCVLESYSPQGKLNWQLLALEFVDRAAEDPGEQTSIYTKDTRYEVDYSKPRGTEWSYRAFTLDRHTYPHDPRMTAGLMTPFVRRIEGRKFLYMNGQNCAIPLGVYRFDPQSAGEIAIPCALFAHRPNEKIPHSPQAGEWIWRDADGDGQFDASEFLSHGEKNGPGAGGFWVDTAGTVWFACGDIRRFELVGLSTWWGQRRGPDFARRGVPLYDYEHAGMIDKPATFKSVKRIRYYPETDVMYLGGTTDAHKNQHWKGMGPVLCRFDGWSKGNRTPRWTVVGTYDASYKRGHVSCEPISFDVAGAYVFVALAGKSKKLGVGWAHIDVYEAATGRKVGFMHPSRDIGQVGLMDVVECIRAFKRPDGEYVVLEEDDYAAKNLMYRWRPE